MSGKTLIQFGLHSPTRYNECIVTNRQYLSLLACDTTYLASIIAENVPKLNVEQKEAHNDILTSVDSNFAGIYFLDAPGGFGKTHLINTN